MNNKYYTCLRCTTILKLKGVYNDIGFLFICPKCGYRYERKSYKLYG